MNNSKKMTTLAIKALEDKKGNDIRVIDIQREVISGHNPI